MFDGWGETMVLNGIDTIDGKQELFKHQRLGLITSASGVDVHLEPTAKVLHRRYGLQALFSPEHGLRGNVEAGGIVDTYIDPVLSIPVHSLYRPGSQSIEPAMLDHLDALVYDIQDIGVRCYTYIATLINALEACAANHVRLIVLDRPDPLGGDRIEGNILEPGFTSFVGPHPIPLRYGLTAGELVLMVKSQRSIDCDVVVVPCLGWSRSMLFPKHGTIWIMPSPAIPRFETALLYAGMVLIEGTNLSEGRGTSCPFELIGAPYVDAERLTEEMNKKNLPGVRFTSAYFTPHASKYASMLCQGVHAHITDADAYLSVQTAVELMATVRRLHPDSFTFLEARAGSDKKPIELLAGSDLFERFGEDSAALLAACALQSAAFSEQKRPFHLYR